MEILLSLGLVVVGGIIGFFVARHWYTRGPTQESVAQAENNLKALLAEQSENHIFQSKQLINNIEKQCVALNDQIESYENLLAKDAVQPAEAEQFFGDQASTYLRNQLGKSDKLKLSSQSDTQPRDFAAAGSGLFTGTAETVAEKDEGTKLDS